MNDDIVISVNKVGKSYRIWNDPSARLLAPCWEGLASFGLGRRWLKARAASQYRDFQALGDVSFDVRKGEAVGIIGRNGSGKSTLLQIVSGTMRATAGSVQVHGRVAALLELGSGFNPEFTGRENVYLNGSVLGLSAGEIDARFAQIAEFADIGDFIDQPVRTYSSGMVVRLAFAVAAHVDPAILIVDEALSVGDARFQLKCARAIDRFIKQGVTLLFVSHDTSLVKRLCNRAVLIEAGRVLYGGSPNDVVNLYSKLIADGGSVASIAADIAALNSGAAASTRPAPTAPGQNAPTIESDDRAQLQRRVKALETILQSHPDSHVLTQRLEKIWQNERSHNQVTGREFTYGGELGLIHDVAVLDRDKLPRTWFNSGEAVTVRMTVEPFEEFTDPIFALTIKNAAGVEIYGTNTLFSKQPVGPVQARSRWQVDFSFALNLMPGDYFLSVGFTHFVGDQLIVVHRRYDVIKLEVHGLDHTFGMVNLHAVINAQELPAPAGNPSSPC
jgi:lipopolysaccharide transport system ATP-binding protein